MDRQPTVRSFSQPLQRGRLQPKKRKLLAGSEAGSIPRLVLLMLQQYPWLVWLAAAAVLAGATTAAVRSIVNPTASAPYHPAPVAISTAVSGNDSLQPAVKAQFAPGHSVVPAAASPLFIGGSILLSCAAGCFLLSQWLKPRHSLVKPSEIAATTNHAPGKTAAPQLNQQASSASQLHPPAESQPPQLQPEAIASETAIEVTVVPDDQDNALDWDEPSLADHLDLRQCRPLSYWL